MGQAKIVSYVFLPEEITKDLPAGTEVYGFDGELVCHGKEIHSILHKHSYSLLPVSHTKEWPWAAPSEPNDQMYERRWPGASPQETYLGIEQFHGQTVTMFCFLFPGKGGQYRTETFAAFSWSTHQWIYITHARTLREVFEGPEAKNIRTFFINSKKRLEQDERYINVMNNVMMDMRHEVSLYLKKETRGNGRL